MRQRIKPIAVIYDSEKKLIRAVIKDYENEDYYSKRFGMYFMLEIPRLLICFLILRREYTALNEIICI